jgi:hypothetical protein
VASVVKCEVIQQLAAIPVVNLLHFAYTGGPPTNVDLDTFSTTVIAAWTAHMLPDLSSELSVIEVISTDLTSPTSARGSHSAVANGGSGAAFLGANSALVISHNIARRYRGGHPRSYIAGLLSADLFDANLITAANRTTFQTDWDAFIAACVVGPIPGTTTITYVNVSYHSAHVLRPVPVVDIITSSTVKQRLGSQRRRVGS